MSVSEIKVQLPEQCKNCQNEVAGNYCSDCGQSVKSFDKPLRFLIIDFAGNLFAFDTRLWRSLIHILFHPGKMEDEYLQGKRIRYMPPFRMYVFMSFIFFLTLSLFTRISIQKNWGVMSVETEQETQETFAIPDVFYQLDQDDNDPLNMEEIVSKSGQSFSNPKIQHIIDNPRIYIERLFKYFSWALFLLMPIYGFLLWVFFRKSKRYYIGHFLLSINQHIFIFAILLILLIIQWVLPDRASHPENYLLLLIPVYSFWGVKKLYQKQWFSTLVRLGVVTFMYNLVLLISTAFVVYLTFA